METPPRKLIAGTNNGHFFIEPHALSPFPNTSKDWYSRTTPIEKTVEKYESIESRTQFVNRSLTDLLPHLTQNGEFGWIDRKNDQFLRPTKIAIAQLGQLLGMGRYPSLLFKSNKGASAELLKRIFDFHIGKTRVRSVNLRIRDNEKLCSITSDSSLVIHNAWYLRQLAKIVPLGRISHWQGDEDSAIGNLLIPNTIRSEADSDYSAMLSFSNYENLASPFVQSPALFRSICTNGLWALDHGAQLNRSSFGKGTILLQEIAAMIENNLLEQIPLTASYLERFMATRRFSTNISMKAVVAQLSLDEKLTKSQSSAILRALAIERQETPDFGETLFGLINGITRAAQTLTPLQWQRFDKMAGRFVSKPKLWESLVSRASTLSPKAVDSRFAHWSMGPAA